MRGHLIVSGVLIGLAVGLLGYVFVVAAVAIATWLAGLW